MSPGASEDGPIVAADGDSVGVSVRGVTDGSGVDGDEVGTFVGVTGVAVGSSV